MINKFNKIVIKYLMLIKQLFINLFFPIHCSLPPTHTKIKNKKGKPKTNLLLSVLYVNSVEYESQNNPAQSGDLRCNQGVFLALVVFQDCVQTKLI